MSPSNTDKPRSLYTRQAAVEQISFTDNRQNTSPNMASYATDDKEKIYTEHSENATSGDLEYRGGQAGTEKHDAQYLADAVEAVKGQKTQGFKSAFAEYK